MDLGLKGKTALVTGASEGIGSAVARKLANEGVRVAINGKLLNGAALVIDGSKSLVI